jgi:hypothetical protein
MPRIRTIKPEFWSDYRMSRLSALDRLIYIALWSMADDAGRIEGDADTVWRFMNLREEPRSHVEEALQRLQECARVALYEIDGAAYIAVLHWKNHQRIEHPSRSQRPKPDGTYDDDGNIHEKPAKIHERSRSRVRAREQGTGNRDINTAAGKTAAAAADFSPSVSDQSPTPDPTRRMLATLDRIFPDRPSWRTSAGRLADATSPDLVERAIVEASKAKTPVKSFKYVESILEAWRAKPPTREPTPTETTVKLTPELIEAQRRNTERMKAMARGIGRPVS